jgi:putative FmdB family regulatory protein
MLYDYGCKSCNYVMTDVYQSIKDDALVKCPRCGQDSLYRMIYGGLGHFVKDAKTIGQLADKNWNELGHYQKSELEQKSKDKKQSSSTFSSAGSATKKEINNMTKEQKTKYIITGEK